MVKSSVVGAFALANWARQKPLSFMVKDGECDLSIDYLSSDFR